MLNEAVNYYKYYRNKLTLLIRKAKEQYYINRIELCKDNGREIWKVINELYGGEKFILPGYQSTK